MAQRHLLPFLILSIAAWGQSPTTPSASDPESVIRNFYQAFNAHDPAQMADRATEDVKWMSVKEATITVETSGRAELKTSMEQYFRGVPTVESKLESLIVTGPYVTVHERVRWKAKSGDKTQSALAVYEVRDGKVARAWYFFPVLP